MPWRDWAGTGVINAIFIVISLASTFDAGAEYASMVVILCQRVWPLDRHFGTWTIDSTAPFVYTPYDATRRQGGMVAGAE